MKYFFLFVFLLCTISLTFAQKKNSILFQNDQLDFRSEPTNINPEWAPFFHGVASGDPLADRVIIWTRVTPDEMNEAPIDVTWQIATDPMLENVVQSGTFTTNIDRDYTVKVDVTGLSSNTTYYYGFSALDKHSLTGRTKTTPVGVDSEHLKFGVVTCSNFQAGYFNSYQNLSKRNDIDAVVHLGDYIYEYPNAVFGDSTLIEDRPIEPQTELLSLEDYRTRYSTYRLDTNLIRLHQQHTFISVWDDHESANNSYVDGAQNHTEGVEGAWEDRKSIAKQVYFEWQPIREVPDQRVYRSISYGNIADLILLDTRLEGREEQLNDALDPALLDEDRTILGTEQREWLFNELSTSTAKWKIIGQQVLFAELNIGWAAFVDDMLDYYQYESLFLDTWDGYPAERTKILDYLETNAIDNVVILSGDAHISNALDITDNPNDLEFIDFPGFGEIPNYSENDTYDPTTGEGSVAVEFMTPSVTSSNFDEQFGAELAVVAQDQVNSEIEVFGGIVNLGNPNPHMKYANLVDHGYMLIDVKPDSVQANWYFNAIAVPDAPEVFDTAMYTLDGANRLNSASTESAPKAEQEEPAPLDPPGLTSVNELDVSNFALLGNYPNPFTETNTLHFSLAKANTVQVKLFKADGTFIADLLQDRLPAGTFSLQLDGTAFAAGQYYYWIKSGKEILTSKLILVK